MMSKKARRCEYCGCECCGYYLCPLWTGSGIRGVAVVVAGVVALVVVGIGGIALFFVGIELLALSGVGKMFAPGWLVEVISWTVVVVGFLAAAGGLVGCWEVFNKRGVAFAVAARRIALFVAFCVVGTWLIALGVVITV